MARRPQTKPRSITMRARALRKVRAVASPIPTSPLRDPEQLAHELRIHHVELEMQNEELRKVQGESELAQAKYRDLYETAPVGYFTLDHQGFIREINHTGVTLLDEPHRLILNRRFLLFVAPAW